jgi:hypothetical protein
MSGLALFDIAREYRDAADKLADLDLPDEVVADTLEGMSGDLEVKATNVAFFARNLEALAASIKDAEANMAARRKALENRAQRMRDYLLNCMQLAGVQKIESPYFRLAQRENPPAVVIDEPGLIPNEYMRQPEPPPPAPDKAAIKADIQRGKEVPGAHLQRGVRLEIR